jgi:hypothetical protein
MTEQMLGELIYEYTIQSTDVDSRAGEGGARS